MSTGARTARTAQPGVDQRRIRGTFIRTNEGFAGIVIGSSSNYVYANRVRLNAYFGIGVVEGADNLLLQNDARYQFFDAWDCYDATVGTGTDGTAIPGRTALATTTVRTKSVSRPFRSSRSRRTSGTRPVLPGRVPLSWA